MDDIIAHPVHVEPIPTDTLPFELPVV